MENFIKRKVRNMIKLRGKLSFLFEQTNKISWSQITSPGNHQGGSVDGYLVKKLFFIHFHSRFKCNILCVFPKALRFTQYMKSVGTPCGCRENVALKGFVQIAAVAVIA